MKRLTKRTNGTVFYCFNGDKYPAQEMDGLDALCVLRKLAYYEDAEEERQKGCCFCTEIPDEGIYGISYDATWNPYIETGYDMLPWK